MREQVSASVGVLLFWVLVVSAAVAWAWVTR
jgi:hypothetical protein